MSIKRIKVKYFASLKEEAACSEELLSTSVHTPGELYEELKIKHNFSLEQENIRATIDDSFVPMDQILKEGNSLAFIPPVAGG
jgi:sulfur-carrier protein